MHGFLTLDPDAATQSRLLTLQNRLRNALSRQGVHFPDRLAPTLLVWPFATLEELDQAAEQIRFSPFPSAGEGPGVRGPEVSDERERGAWPNLVSLESLHGRPNDDRPAEAGLSLAGCEDLQTTLAAILKQTLDPDPPKPPFIRLARVSPPSRKVGAALRASALPGADAGPFVPCSLTLWRQTPQGFEIHQTLEFGG